MDYINVRVALTDTGFTWSFDDPTLTKEECDGILRDGIKIADKIQESIDLHKPAPGVFCMRIKVW